MSTTETTTSEVSGSNPSFTLVSAQKVTYEERPVPKLDSPHDVLVRIGWTGICGSDVHYWTDMRIGPFVVEKPMVLGHESSGTIAAVGDQVTSLKVGDRVALEPGVPCRRCVPCKSGHYNLCPEMAFASTPPYDGTLCKFYSLPADFCYKLPEHVDLMQGALVEPTAVAVHIVKQASLSPGDKVVVFGAGPVGLLCAAVARAFGAGEICIVDIVEERLRFAGAWLRGVETFQSDIKDNAEVNAQKLREAIPGLKDGADAVIDASGAASSCSTGIAVCRRGGTYVQGGMGRDTHPAFPIMAVCTNEITVKGSFRYGSGDYKLAVELISNGQIHVKPLITKKVKFGDAEEAFASVKRGEGIKQLIEAPRD